MVRSTGDNPKEKKRQEAFQGILNRITPYNLKFFTDKVGCTRPLECMLVCVDASEYVDLTQSTARKQLLAQQTLRVWTLLGHYVTHQEGRDSNIYVCSMPADH